MRKDTNVSLEIAFPLATLYILVLCIHILQIFFPACLFIVVLLLEAANFSVSIENFLCPFFFQLSAYITFIHSWQLTSCLKK